MVHAKYLFSLIVISNVCTVFASEDIRYQCPITPGYMFSKLTEASEQLKNWDTDIEKSIKTIKYASIHFLRVSCDSQKMKWVTTKSKCNYFMLNVDADVFTRILSRYRECKSKTCEELDLYKQLLVNNSTKLQKQVAECKKWVKSEFKNMDALLNTLYCK